MKRRGVLTGLALASLGACSAPAVRTRSRSVERVGLQLYTVRDRMAQDVAGTLNGVAEMGYTEVETAGTGDLTAVQFARALTQAGLTAPAAHVPLNLLAEQPDMVLQAAQTVGYKYVVVPWLPPELRCRAGVSLLYQRPPRYC